MWTSWFYVQSDTSLPVNVFNNFRNICLEIHELDPAHFLSATGLVWKAALKKTKVKLGLWTDIYMSLMVEKGIIGGICHASYQCAKTKAMMKIKNLHIWKCRK